MNKIFYTLLLIFNTISCTNAAAQKISDKVLSKFPHSLSINMYNDVLSKMDVPENLQVNLQPVTVNSPIFALSLFIKNFFQIKIKKFTHYATKLPFWHTSQGAYRYYTIISILNYLFI